MYNYSGLLLCAHYSVAPNFFGYCGPDKNSNLIDHLRDNIADREVSTILKDFDTLYFYLQLIAAENKIIDPFDHKVVEAYWVGNSLLKNISNLNYTYFLQENFLFNKKITENIYIDVKSKVMQNKFLPHHSFHVFNIFKRTGNDPSFHTLKTMDECRIGYGKIKNQISKFKNLIIETKPLEIVNNKLRLGKPVLKEVKLDYKGKTFLKNLKVGDYISFHWSFACDILSISQVNNLEYYTKQSINFYNL